MDKYALDERLDEKEHQRPIIGFTASCFDLGPHAGHLHMLEKAKQHCDKLIVALQIDPSLDRPEKNKPVQSVVERAMALRACKFVDEIIPYQTEDDLIQLIHLLEPDLRFLGEDYIGKTFTGSDIQGVTTMFLKRRHAVSSSGLRRKVKGNV